MKRIFKILLTIAVSAMLIGATAWIATAPAIRESTYTHYIDAHVHTAGIGAGGSGAFINQSMADSYKFRIYLWAMGVTRKQVEAEGDIAILRNISRQILESDRVGSAVILAMDGVIDDDGKLDRDRTQIFVPNEFLMRELPQFKNLYFGASINPYRPDALERLEQVSAAGAVLIKWIPNIMQIDPADPAIEAFYRKMVALELPLLCHTGQERSFADANDQYGDPVRLELPLSLGVKVIAAHIATTGKNDHQRNYDRILPLFHRYPNLYTDISSLTQLNKLNYLVDALTQAGLQERMIYGSDWPLQFIPLVSPLYHLNHISIAEAKSIARLKNQWDRDVALKEALGVPPEAFERSRSLLNL